MFTSAMKTWHGLPCKWVFKVEAKFRLRRLCSLLPPAMAWLVPPTYSWRTVLVRSRARYSSADIQSIFKAACMVGIWTGSRCTVKV